MPFFLGLGLFDSFARANSDCDLTTPHLVMGHLSGVLEVLKGILFILPRDFTVVFSTTFWQPYEAFDHYLSPPSCVSASFYPFGTP